MEIGKRLLPGRLNAQNKNPLHKLEILAECPAVVAGFCVIVTGMPHGEHLQAIGGHRYHAKEKIIKGDLEGDLEGAINKSKGLGFRV